MSDREFSGNDDLTLPKATVDKIIKEVLHQVEPGLVFAKETRDLLTECCVEFITLISSEANEIAEKDAKKTIACEHVVQALQELDFNDYITPVKAVAKEHKVEQQRKEKKQSKMEQSGMTEEELLRQQAELFQQATEKFNAA